MTKIYVTMMAVGLFGFAMAFTGCGGALPAQTAPAHADEAVAGCWEPIASVAAPTVEWVGGNGFSVDTGTATLYVAWKGGERISDTQLAAAVDAYWQLTVAARGDLSSEHVAHCQAYLQAVGL